MRNPTPMTSSPEPPDGGRLEKNVEIGTLCAYYGGLLTPHQREALMLYYHEDLSLGEIAEQYGVTRQNIHHLLARSIEKLERYEAALGSMQRARSLSAGLRAVQDELQKARGLANSLAGAHIEAAVQRLTQMAADMEIEEG